MKQTTFHILENTKLTGDVKKLVLKGDTSQIREGQFVNLLIDGCFLRRPLSVCDVTEEHLVLIYKVVGRGTKKLAQMTGGAMDALTGLGNGYDRTVSGASPLLIGGGVGVPPLYLLAKRLTEDGKDVSVILGFNRSDEIFYEAQFRALGCRVTVTTADGSYGVRGFVTEAMDTGYSYVYACGPEAMLRAVYQKSETSGQFSFEERMGCGFGACMGCSCKTVTGYKRICKDGPVLQKEEILWER